VTRLRPALALLAVVLIGCRSDVREVRLDLTQAARLLRAYGSAAGARASAPAPPEVARLSPERLNDLGVMLERRGMLERAGQHYRLAVERKPGFARAWVNLGNVARDQGRAEEALAHYRRAMREDPELFEAINNFADLCGDTGRCVEQALAFLTAALEKHPAEESAGRDTLGRLLLRSGRPAEAASAFRAALARGDPRERAFMAEVLQHLAQAYRVLGEQGAARGAELRAAALEQSVKAHRPAPAPSP
jgi:tetratricopeptide (TPR) repeat protein